jgi:hypothetical protein
MIKHKRNFIETSTFAIYAMLAIFSTTIGFIWEKILTKIFGRKDR